MFTSLKDFNKIFYKNSVLKVDLKKSRINTLDGFRALAILAVMLFHYFSRWTPPHNPVSKYPYNDSYDYFNYGYLGVNFFFIISGFVIFFTLENTLNFTSFWKKRFIRLFPSMVFAAVITYVICALFDNNNLFPGSHLAKNILPSLTFINPFIINKLFNTNIGYISGTYWSLWPEIQFYLFSSTVYYLNKKKFIRNFLIISTGLIAVNYLLQNLNGSNLIKNDFLSHFLAVYSLWIQKGFNLIVYLPFFIMGIIFYLLFKNNLSKVGTPMVIKIFLGLLILFAVFTTIELPVRIAYLSMCLLFLVFIYYPKNLNILEDKGLTSIGKSSYFLYLIHENIGVLCIYSFGTYFLPFGFVITILIIYFLILSSNFFTVKIDSYLHTRLKNIINVSK